MQAIYPPAFLRRLYNITDTGISFVKAGPAAITTKHPE
jgi:hypothetical protein